MTLANKFHMKKIKKIHKKAQDFNKKLTIIWNILEHKINQLYIQYHLQMQLILFIVIQIFYNSDNIQIWIYCFKIRFFMVKIIQIYLEIMRIQEIIDIIISFRIKN